MILHDFWITSFITLTKDYLLFIFGAIIGSFLNVVIYRLPRCKITEKVLTKLKNQNVESNIIQAINSLKDKEFDNEEKLETALNDLEIDISEDIKAIILDYANKEINIAFPSSHCPNCNKPIRGYDNIPILSWFILMGKCRDCKNKISFRYPLNEAITAIMFLGLFYFSDNNIIKWLFLCYFFSILLIIFWIDIDHQLILNVTTLPSIIIGFAYSYFITHNIVASLIACIGGYLFFWVTGYLSTILLKKEGLGGGDVKFAAMLGAWMGWQKLFISLFISFLVGSIIGLIFLAKKRRSEPFPFGPSMVIGSVIGFFFGDLIWFWYINSFKF